MEKLMNPYNKESMRLAMLKHEEVFKEQIFELHRLYQIQKMLMKNIKRSGQNNQEHNARNFKKREEKIECLDLEREADEEESNNKIVDESELLELTLGPSKNFHRMRKVANNSPLSLLQSDNYSRTSLSSSSSSNYDVHHHHHHQRLNTSRQHGTSQKWRVDNHVPIKSNHRSFLGERKNGANNVVGEENLRSLNNNNPPWFFQVLSLKMT